MLFSLLVLDAGEPRQTGMDIWRESGSGLAALMPAPQKTFTHAPTQNTHQHCLVSVVQSATTSCRLIISEPVPPWFFLFCSPVAPLGQRLDRSRKRPPGERENGKAPKAPFKETDQRGLLPCLVPVRIGSFYVFCLGPAPPAGLEIRSKSHRSSSV